MRRRYNMREKILTFVLLLCAGVCGSTVSNSHELPIEIPIATISDDFQETSFAANEESDGKSGRQSDADTDHYLRVVSELQNQSLVSGKRAQFKCKVEGHPIENLAFTWYMGNQVIDPTDNRRISIRQKNGMSRLQINDVFTSDTGMYRCEASNGFQRVATQAYLEVKFSLPPPPGKDEIIESHIPTGTCEIYNGDACATYLRGKFVYVDPYQKQTEVEKSISAALGRISDPEIVSPSCQRYAIPALCYFVFPVCADDVTRNIRGKPSAEDRSKKLCREDCELLMHDVCKDEFMNPDDDVFMEKLATETNCSLLPRTTAQGTNCMKVGLKPVVDKSHTCYNATGESYLGTARKTVSGLPCKTWPLDLVQKYRELSGGHNFCRNPGSVDDKPWCFIDNARKEKEICDISKCSTSSGSELITILIPSVAIPLLIGCIGAVFFVCCRGNKKRKSDKGIPGKQVKCNEMQAVEMTLSSAKNVSNVPQLNPSSVHFTMELGDGQFGKVYKAQVMQNMQYNTNFPVAVKTLIEGAMPQQIDEFYREIEIFSEIQHPNVACLKAVVCQPNRNYMVFEYTNRVDLHEFLSLHSPHSDVGGTKVTASSASSQASSTLEQGDFVNMMTQIASGLDYLSSRNFVHRDLAARNILVCQNNVLKICNLGVVRDCYLSSYYRSPQGGHMLPIRWMAPESLTSSTFSIKTTVWSFGVLLWEMTSYGLQPYCGYSNQEVLDMITRFQLLSCPDQCPSRVYALMHECWSQDPISRPTFKDIYAKLTGWEGANATRMTSQLARGIHRQLTNIMREGQHGQYSSLDSASIPSYNSNMGTPSPPPTYTSVTGNSVGYFSNAQHQFVTPAAPNVSPASHNVFNSTSPATTNSSVPMYPQGQGQRLIVDLPGSQDPPQQPHSYTKPGFLSSNAQNFGPRYYAEQQPNYAPQNNHAQSQSSRSTSSCASSSREFSPVRRPNPPPNYPPRSNQGYNNQTNDQYHYSQPGQQKFYGGIDYPQNYQPLRALSDVIEDETSVTTGNKRVSQPPSAAVAPYSIGPDVENLNMTVMTDSSRVSDLKTNGKNVTSPKRGTDETESSTSSTSSSVQAPSCDSGLPVDEDGELLGSHTTTCQTTSLTSPLIAPKTFPKSQNFSGSRRTVVKGPNDKPSNFA